MIQSVQCRAQPPPTTALMVPNNPIGTIVCVVSPPKPPPPPSASEPEVLLDQTHGEGYTSTTTIEYYKKDG